MHRSTTEPWRVTLVDTGEETMTGGRLQRVLPYVEGEDFCFTYGDGARRHRHHGARSPSTARRARSPPSPPCSLPGASARWTSTARACQLRGEAARRRRLDQRRLLRALARRRPVHRRATDRLGAGADARAGARRPARRPTGTTVSGRRWTRCATETSSSSCGAPGRALADWEWLVTEPSLARVGSVDGSFWRDRRVLLTGHTGFKGAWLALWLQALGARVTASRSVCLPSPSLYELARVGEGIESIEGDVRDSEPRCRGDRAARARGRHPHGRAVARAPLLRRAARDLRDQRHGHRQPARRRAPDAGRACAPWST